MYSNIKIFCSMISGTCMAASAYQTSNYALSFLNDLKAEVMDQWFRGEDLGSITSTLIAVHNCL